MKAHLKQMPYVWLVIIGQLLVHSHAEHLDLLDITKMCPYTEFCTSNATEALQNSAMLPSCSACFCSGFCWARADCCIDIKTPRPTNIAELEEAVECVPESQQIVQGQLVATEDTQYLWMIARCIGPAYGSNFSEQCHVTADTNVVNLIPVWSNSTIEVYRNKYCALCYNVTDYELFMLDIGELNGYLDVEDDSSWDVIDYLLRHPSSTGQVVTVYAKDAIRGRLSFCHRTFNSECHTSTYVGQNEEILKDLCTTFPYHPYKITLNGLVFKNVYCYLCSTHNYTYNEMFVVLPPGWYLNAMRLGAPIYPPSYNSRQVRVGFDRPIEHVNWKCLEEEILDPYMKMCRSLVCPESSLPYKGVCYYTQGYETPHTISFRVTADATMYPSLVITAGLIVSRLTTSTLVSEDVCSIHVGVNQTQSNTMFSASVYFASLGFQTHVTRGILGYRYVGRLHEYLSSEFKLANKITSQLMKGVDARELQYNELILLSENHCNGSFELIRMWCPTLELSESDFRYCVTHNILPPDYEFNNQAAIAVNRSAARQICLQDYLHAWQRAARGNELQIRPMLLWLYVLAACWLQ